MASDMSELPSSTERFCYVTTTGRRTGRPHTIEIWYVASGDTIYILMGGGDHADTVRNSRSDPRARVRIGEREYNAIARILEDEADGEAVFAREQIPRKYANEEAGLEAWAQGALPVAFDLQRPR